MHYTLGYDISSLVLLLILAFFYFNMSKYNTFQNNVFGVLILDAIGACVFDLSSAAFMYHFPRSIFLNSAALMLYQLCQHSLPMMYLLYMLCVIYGDRIVEKLRSPLSILFVPGTVMLLTDITSPLTNWGYVYDADGYHRTVLYLANVLISGGYVVACLVMAFINRKKVGFMAHIAVTSYSVLTIVLAIIQGLKPNLLLVNSAATISIFILYLSLQNPALIKEALQEAEESRKAAEEANEAKSVFLANISHEIRTPMNAIFGMTYLLEDRDLKNDAREYVNTIRTASENLLSLVNDILDFSKADSGKLSLDPTEYKIEELVKDVFSMMIPQVNQDKIVPTLYIDPDVPKVLKGDVIKTRQILINFLSNAIKFTDNGEIMTHISAVKDETNGKVRLSLKVRDTGIGIKDEDKEKIFQQFEQVDMAKNRKREGAGLGLALVKGLCELMNGSVELESEYGRGSTFTAIVEQEYVEGFSGAYKEKISPYAYIVAESNPYVRKSIEKTLRSVGVTYKIAESFSVEDRNQFANRKCCVICSFDDFDFLKKEADDVGATDLIWLVMVDYGMGKPENLSGVFFECAPFSLITLMDFGVQSAVKGSNAVEENLYFSNAVKVAIVDDNKVNLKVTKALLNKFGIEADTMLSGFEMLDALNNGAQYDLIFMDHMMPEMDGVETVRKIRAMEKHNSDKIPIVALTANAVDGVEQEFLDAGMNDALFKPVVIDDLKHILIKWLPKNSR